MASEPAFIYDGHCSFCRMWLAYIQALAGDRVAWIASQQIGEQYSEIPRDELKESAFFIDASGRVSRGAEAIFGVLALSPRHRWLLRIYRAFAPFARIADVLYRYTAHHRDLAYAITRGLFGTEIRPRRYQITESLFLRLLGIVFLFAFWSLQGQILALAGSHGIIPAAQVLPAMKTELGSSPWLVVPTIFWFRVSDGWLWVACTAGIVASIVLIISAWLGHLWQRLCVLACFLLYLSVVSIDQPFTLFQWDALLLETAFLALFAGSPMAVWAFRVLLFRLMFESGCVKLLSGDPNWRNLHALRFHFMTQPLPNPVAWYVYQAPGWLLDSLTFLSLAIELVCPFLLFFPRRVRHKSAVLLIALQISIILTGNYAFFNLLTIALCLWAFDDDTFSALKRLLGRATIAWGDTRWRRASSAVLAFLILLGVVQVLSMFAPAVNRPFSGVMRTIGPWQILNSYGLFAVMTTTRPEINFEGSNDGQTWREYSFPYKPGDVNRSLPLVAPFQPRVDWQLWFAALDGNFQEDRWTGNLAVRLLDGEPTVLRLLNPPPFASPPKYVRALLYDYWFTTASERKKTGAIWNRRFERIYLPAISLDMLRRSR
jgi:predicted DCC family thiol-disulfide oxidoreductase YuxK